MQTSQYQQQLQVRAAWDGLVGRASIISGRCSAVVQEWGTHVLACCCKQLCSTLHAPWPPLESMMRSMCAGDVKPLKKPPTWLRRPSGACFGFGGRLVSFSNHTQQLTDPMTGQVRPVETGTVNITQVVTEHQLVEHSEAFENAIAGRDRSALQVCAGVL